MTDLEFIYEEVFGEEEDREELSYMIEKTGYFDKGRIVFMYKIYAAKSCSKMMLKAIKKLKKKCPDMAKELEKYEKDLTAVLENSKNLIKDGSIQRMNESKVSSKMNSISKILDKYIKILFPICKENKVRLFTFMTGNMSKSTIKNFNDYVIYYSNKSGMYSGAVF